MLDRKILLVALNGFSLKVGRKGAIGKLMGVSVSLISPELLQISGRQLILIEKLFSINMPRLTCAVIAKKSRYGKTRRIERKKQRL
jgi:hypothetical protein